MKNLSLHEQSTLNVLKNLIKEHGESAVSKIGYKTIKLLETRQSTIKKEI